MSHGELLMPDYFLLEEAMLVSTHGFLHILQTVSVPRLHSVKFHGLEYLGGKWEAKKSDALCQDLSPTLGMKHWGDSMPGDTPANLPRGTLFF